MIAWDILKGHLAEHSGYRGFAIPELLFTLLSIGNLILALVLMSHRGLILLSK